MPRVRFAPSPTGYLHIGSARTFIFNWLYARHNSGTMILRTDDTDVERNTQQSLDSIFEGLHWLDLAWDEFYRQSERLDLHARAANEILEKGLAYRDFTPASTEHSESHWLFNPGMPELSKAESDRRAAAGEPFVVRYRVPRETRAEVAFTDLVYGPQSKATADIEDFALLRSNGVPTYHLASCADDADLKISHIIRGQDHLTNTFKHVLIFEALGVEPPKFAHLPLLIAPDGSKLSKRKHGPVVSVTTYRDAGFLAQSFINFLCLLGWSPKNDREQMSLQELTEVFTLEGVNKSNARVTFTEKDPFDPKALWLNAQHLRALPISDLAAKLIPFAEEAGFAVPDGEMLKVARLIRERIKLLKDVETVGRSFFVDPEYDAGLLIPAKRDAAFAKQALGELYDAVSVHPERLPNPHPHPVDAALAEASRILNSLWEDGSDPGGLKSVVEAISQRLDAKSKEVFHVLRVAEWGKPDMPPLFESLQILGRTVCLRRIKTAIEKL
jgi:glutamyl-tRNA synthetase